MKSTYVYAVFHAPTKSYVLDSGYYGNQVNIKCFPDKDSCQAHIDAYYRQQGYRPKGMRV